jgi:hypothetical protein
MNALFKLSTVLAVVVFSGISCKNPGHQPHSSGWRPLFDGKSTDGWAMTGPGELQLENGRLVTHGGMGLLWYTKEKLGNCQIRVVFRLTGGEDNSGVFIRIPEPPKDPWFGVNRGYEVQIDNRGDEYHHTGCLYSLTKARHVVSPKVGEWATMLITLKGKRTVVEVNGEGVTEFTEGDLVPEKKIWYEPERGLRPEFGYVGLQNHGDEARVYFKEVSVKSLNR